MDQSSSHSKITYPTNKRLGRRKRRVDEREGLDSATANTRSGRSHTQVQVRNALQNQLPHAAIPPDPGATPDVAQSSTIFQNAHSVNVSGNPSFQNQNIGSVTNVYGGERDDLERLERFVSFDAQCDSSVQDPTRRCHPGTRENVLRRLRDWIDNPKAKERIAWLYGPAGAGKSAIAQTIARSYDRPTVAGTFFFFKSDHNRNDGSRLFTTLAYQLALAMPEIRCHIARSLSERPDIPRADIETQFKQLLARPFHVLRDDAPQQLAPVIIIDGVDECADENVQRQFLKVIGNAVKNDRFPLRFLIVSRPEVHIEKTISPFEDLILNIDLAKLDDANRDIEKYLKDEFSRIASEQSLDPTWPGQKIIDNIVYKSSGYFIFASLVIKFVGDPYFFAKTQLEIILNMKPPKNMSPFAILDQLFLEILGRVPDQGFLKRYLALLVARISIPARDHSELHKDYGKLHEDDAVLMHLSQQELHANLRRMRSLLKFEPIIDIHHRSFLDFLQDPTRSSQYHVQQGGIKGYMEVFVDSLVRYASTVIEQPTPHNTPHFTPKFRTMIKNYPLKIHLSAKDWQEVTQPLLDLQDKLLQLPNFSSAWDLLPCDQCSVFHLLRELLHLGLHLGLLPDPVYVKEASASNLRKRKGVISITDRTGKKTDQDVDSIILSLFAHLPETLENWLPNKRVMNLMSTVLSFDYAEIVMRIRSTSDAQKLIDLLDHMIHAKDVLHPDARHKAGLLALKVFARVPIVPLSYILTGDHNMNRDMFTDTKTIHIEILCQTLFADRILDYRYINPMGKVTRGVDYIPSKSGGDSKYMTMHLWQHNVTASSATKTRIILQLAKAIQYLHSMNVVLDHEFHSVNVLLASDLYPTICCWYSTSQFLLDKEGKERFLSHENIFSFGGLCYELYAGSNTWKDYPTSSGRRVIPKRLSGIPENAWQLIQSCCAEDSKYRPTIDEVVKEIEGWYRAGNVKLSARDRIGEVRSFFSGLRKK